MGIQLAKAQISIQISFASQLFHSLTLRLFHSHKNLPLARPIELTKKNPLPGPQRQFPAFHKNQLASSDHHCLSVGIRIPLRVPVRPRPRHEPVKHAL